MTNYEDLIFSMLDEIIGKGSSESHYSIIEKYFKKIEEDTRDNTIGRCLDVVESSGAYDGVKRIIINRIKKL